MENLEKDGMVTPPVSNVEAYELQSLRQELLLRIALQNLLLILAVALFAAIAAVGIAVPSGLWHCAAVLNCAVFALALQWCHHGIRTAQIKQYLMLADRNLSGWERWLPANRPARLLGSRWMISTKGVFLGLGAAMIGMASWLTPAAGWVLPATAFMLWIASAGFLLTNPKE
jgi:hypothetical protein